MTKKELSFSVDSQLLGELGERLVTKNYIALAELIKNAYDADSPTVTIRFLNTENISKKKESGEIQVIDTGHGMTLSNIEDFFMRVATSNKRWEPVTKRFGRIKTGNKGIGRFACRRLAYKLAIETTAQTEKGEFELTKVDFNWHVFNAGKDLQTIKITAETEKAASQKTGTILRLIGLTESWTPHKFTLLKRQVLTLSKMSATKRKRYEEDPGFQILFDAPEFQDEKEKILADEVMDGGWGTITSKLNTDGYFELTLNAKDISPDPYAIPKKFDKIKGVSFKIAWLPVINKEYFRDPKLFTHSALLELLNDQGGVRVYFDDFRVFPYGESGNDWLGFDRLVARRKGTPDEIFSSLITSLDFPADYQSRLLLGHPTNRSLIGQVYVSSDSTDGFEIKLNREGFIENESYQQLVELLQLSVQWMTIEYERFKVSFNSERISTSADKIQKSLKDLKNEPEIVNFSPASLMPPTANTALTVLTSQAKMAFSEYPPDTRKKAEELTDNISEFLEHSIYQYSSLLAAVASTGSLMFAFNHEIKGLISRLDTHANSIERLSKNLPKDQQNEMKNLAESFKVTRDRFDQYIKFFTVLSQKTKITDKKEISLKKCSEEIIESFDYLINYYNLNKPIIDIPDNLRSKPMIEAEFYSILINLLSNSIKAIIASPEGKNIVIKARKANGKIILSILDDGIGISDNYRQMAFTPLNPDPEKRLYKALEQRIADKDLAALGRGTGLGLSIVKIIVEKYGGSVQFIDTDTPWKTCVEVVLP